MNGERLLVVTPCRDEEAYAPRAIASVLAQTRRPDHWVIVDDGSKDGTPGILEQLAREHDFVELVRAEDRGRRSVGPGVVDAFYRGLEQVGFGSFAYVCKLDLDVELPPRYFEILLERMKADPRLGTCSGKPYVETPDGGLLPERCGDEMSVGMTKLYRRTCFEQIGGFVREVMWDGIDCHRCRMLGWIARSWDEPGLRFVHLRPMGSSQRGVWEGRKRHGYGQYFMGTGLLFITASSLYRMVQRPYVLGALAIWWGWVASALRRLPRYQDHAFRQFLRRYQRLSLVLGKRRAVERIEQESEDVWNPT